MVFVINLLNDRISLLERQLKEKNSIIDFLVKHQMSPIATYSNIDYENKILNNESTDVVKNKSLPKVVGGTSSGPIPRNGKTKKFLIY